MLRLPAQTQSPKTLTEILKTMNIIDFSYNGIKNTFASFSLFNISINGKKDKLLLQETIKPELQEINKAPTFNDFKTTLGGCNIDLIEKINDNLIVYLFIEKDKEHSSWNLIAPIILEKSTGKINQYGLGYFALEGSGGGLANTSSMMFHLKKHKEKGFNVSILPKIVDNSYLTNFEYFDSGIRLKDLVDNSIDLINYRKGSFEWIYKQYQELIVKYEL